MKLLITGSNGFIGKKLVEILCQHNYEVYAVDRRDGNIGQQSTWDKFPKVDIVIHLASKTVVPDSWIKPVDFLETNLMGTINALDYCKRYNAKIIFLSSSIYSDTAFQPLSENDNITTKHPYGLSKKISEEISKFYADHFNIKVTILRLFNVYGPNQNSSFLIPTILKQVYENKLIKVRDLRPKRDYVYIDDVIRAIIISMKKDENFGIYNIGTGKSYSVKELIDTIQCVSKTSLKVESLDIERNGEVLDSCADITHAKLNLNWRPLIDLKTGINYIVSSMKKNTKSNFE